MTMYVRTTVPMALTISSPTADDDVLLDGDHPVAVLPLWAAQRDEFQALWAEGKVEVATDLNFNTIVYQIPAGELTGGGGAARNVRFQNGSFTISQADENTLVQVFNDNNGDPITVTVPEDIEFTVGTRIEIVRLGDQPVFFEAPGNNTLLLAAGDVYDIPVVNGTGTLDCIFQEPAWNGPGIFTVWLFTTGGAVDTSQFIQADDGGRVPNSALHTSIPLDDALGTNGGQSVVRFLDTGASASNHLSVQNANTGQPITLGTIGDDTDISINLSPSGAGKVTVNGDRVLTSTQPLNRQFGDYTLTAADAGALVTVDSNSPQTVIIPASTSVNYPEGTIIDVVRFGVGAVSFGWQAGVNLFATPGHKITNRYQSARLTKIGPDSWLLTGSLSA